LKLRLKGNLAPILLNKKAAHFSSFPVRKIYKGKRKPKKMKVLRQILLLTAIMIGFSLTATAQRQDPKKDPPPKQDPPKIRVEDKKDKDKPKDDRKNNDKKKPEMAFVIISNKIEIV
jgi:hypothetical protein